MLAPEPALQPPLHCPRMDELADLGVVEAAGRLRQREFSAVELLAACEQAIAARNGGPPSFDGSPQAVNAFETALKAAGKDVEFFRYDAEHAFANEQRASVHDRHATELAWDRATAFFKKHLG